MQLCILGTQLLLLPDTLNQWYTYSYPICQVTIGVVGTTVVPYKATSMLHCNNAVPLLVLLLLLLHSAG
jgi:hypothetical protein